MDNLYTVLGLEKSATQDEIKKAYRNLAFKYHPDRNQGDKIAEEKFKQINSAYSVLGDPDKRRQYDMYGDNASSYGTAGQGNGYSNSYGNGYANRGPYGNSNGYGQEDPFWDFFNGFAQEQQDNQNKGYTYTYTSRNTEQPTKKDAWRYLFSNLVQMIVSLGFMLFFGRYIFLIGIISLIGFGKGVAGVIQAIKVLRIKGKK